MRANATRSHRTLQWIGGERQFVNCHNGKAWDGDGDSVATADGITVRQWEHAGGTHQQSCPQAPGTSGQYRFVARCSGKCPAAGGSSSDDGAHLPQQPFSGAPARRSHRPADSPHTIRGPYSHTVEPFVPAVPCTS
ncbi:RICIN domain-containing protein [Streptomyces sp. ActVer]|uniref:RICIN domain-containing protein n=1 Tax=Streptomyces sp. ActVer TaxID=3014558 RepID=UPI0034DD07E0